jgi:hypothetical protein
MPKFWSLARHMDIDFTGKDVPRKPAEDLIDDFRNSLEMKDNPLASSKEKKMSLANSGISKEFRGKKISGLLS